MKALMAMLVNWRTRIGTQGSRVVFDFKRESRSAQNTAGLSRAPRQHRANLIRMNSQPAPRPKRIIFWMLWLALQSGLVMIYFILRREVTTGNSLNPAL
jgi:hypothetical protein